MAAILALAAPGAWAVSDLVVTLTADPGSVQPGASGSDLTDITVTLRNAGPDAASAVVTTVLPADLAIPAGLSATAGQGSYDPLLGRWTVGILGADQATTLLIPAQVTSTATGCLVSTASATFVSGSTDGDPDAANNNGRLAIGAPACGDLVVSFRRDDKVNGSCGDALQIIRVTNAGATAASGVSLNITRYEVTSPSNYSEASCTSGNVVVPGPQVIDLGTIEAGASKEYTTGLRDIPVDGPDIDVAYDFRASATEPDSDTDDNRQNGKYTINRPLDDDNWKSVCIVSGALGGSGMERYLPELRRLRDRYLMTSQLGRALVRWYYQYSPPVAQRMAQHDSLRLAIRALLAPLVYAVCYPVAALALLAGAAGYFGYAAGLRSRDRSALAPEQPPRHGAERQARSDRPREGRDGIKDRAGVLV